MPFAILVSDYMRRKEEEKGIYHKPGIMNRIVKQFDKSFEVIKKKKDWPCIYVGVDIHETVVKPTWTSNIDKEFYPLAKETLQLMSEDEAVKIILWSCSRKELNVQYSAYFQENDITFDYINENPECKSTVYADFDTKLYFNVGLDDKFGFDPHEDWKALHKYFYKRKMRREGKNNFLDLRYFFSRF